MGCSLCLAGRNRRYGDTRATSLSIDPLAGPLPLQRKEIIEGNPESVSHDQGAFILVDFPGFPGNGLLGPARFFLVRPEVGHSHLRMLVKHTDQHLQPPVLLRFGALAQLDPLRSQPPRLLEDRLISSQGGKGRELGRPVMHGHLGIGRRDMVWHVEHIVVFSSHA